jgi:DnaK suppressor protein
MKARASATFNRIEQSTTSSKTLRSPRAQGLTASQLRELQAKLIGLRDELKTSIHGKAVFVVNSAEHAESLIKGDDAEVAEKQRASNAALQELDILKNRLTLVERALSKIPAGAYGLCEETEEPIGYERLTVVPWARYSVHVQELRERKLREFRVNKLRSEA